jgi:hypothetical protein
MRTTQARVLAIAAVLAGWTVAAPIGAQEKPKVAIPQPGVPEIATIEGAFVRAAYNNEGYFILGYKTANMSVGDEFMLLEIGATVRDGVPAYKLKREDVKLETPDGAQITMMTVEEYRKADLRALNNRANVARDSINYFPPMASRGCRIGYFSELGQAALPWEDVELSNQRACLGRVYYRVPGGIKYGQHYKDIRKQVQEAFAPKKK